MDNNTLWIGTYSKGLHALDLTQIKSNIMQWGIVPIR